MAGGRHWHLLSICYAISLLFFMRALWVKLEPVWYMRKQSWSSFSSSYIADRCKLRLVRYKVPLTQTSAIRNFRPLKSWIVWMPCFVRGHYSTQSTYRTFNVLSKLDLLKPFCIWCFQKAWVYMCSHINTVEVLILFQCLTNWSEAQLILFHTDG